MIKVGQYGGKKSNKVHRKDLEGINLGEINSKRREDIQMILEKDASLFVPQDLYLSIQNCINDLCKAKCGRVPEKEANCKDRSCKIRLISDNASFHFERNWMELLKNDLIKLLSMKNEMEAEEE